MFNEGKMYCRKNEKEKRRKKMKKKYMVLNSKWMVCGTKVGIGPVSHARLPGSRVSFYFCHFLFFLLFFFSGEIFFHLSPLFYLTGTLLNCNSDAAGMRSIKFHLHV